MLTQEEADSIIDTINERATEVRSLIITIGSILALLMPAVEMIGIIDFTPYGEGDDEWIGDDDWEWGDDFYCVGDNTRIEASMVNDGYKNCRDGSDEDESLPSNPDVTNPTIYGCTDEAALNYDDEATDDDDSCSYPAYGCTDPDAENYDEEADTEDGSCEYEEEVIKGCTDSDAENYDEEAEADDGSCEYYEPIEGCTDPDAENYDEGAEVDNGSCEYEEPVEQECIPEMYDAWWLYNESYDIIYIEWDADLSCSDRSHNLTVYWTIYENETGNWTGLQEVLTYETYYQDWDYVNLTLTNLTDGRYDIFATFSIKQNGEDRYSRAVDWYDVCVGEC
tara:strand:+ start:72 stop:1082 length:1011 start_codon:yes stop_codon:yes gene_type:complete